MSQLSQLQEQRNNLAANIKQHATDNLVDNKWKDAEAEKAWNALNADYDKCVGEMESLQRADAVSNRLAEINDLQAGPTPIQSAGGVVPGRENASGNNIGGRSIGGGETCTEEHRALAMAAWMKRQVGEEVSDRDEQAARLAGVNLNRKQLVFNSPTTQWVNQLASSYRALHPSKREQIKTGQYFNAPLTTQTAGTGGNVIPPETLMRELEINMLAFSGMAQVADLMVTESGETLSWPTVDDTDHTGVQIGENTNLDNSGSGGDAPDFGKVQWDAYKLSSQAILVPYELLEDNVVNLPQVLGQLMGERIGRLRNQRYTTGTGSSQATGIVTAATLGVTAASATAIAPDEVYELQHSVDPAYRNGAAFMCHDSIVYYLRTLKDTQNRYLWQSGFNAGVPDTLAGAPLVVNQDMDSSVATTNKTLLYGQLSKYKIRRVNGFRMYRLEERYRDSDQDGFIMLVREDGNLLDAGTAPVKFLQQA